MHRAIAGRPRLGSNAALDARFLAALGMDGSRLTAHGSLLTAHCLLFQPPTPQRQLAGLLADPETHLPIKAIVQAANDP